MWGWGWGGGGLMSCDERHSLATISNKTAIHLCTRNVGVWWRGLPPPSPDIFARFQKVNLYLDVSIPSRAPTFSGSPRYMRPALGGIPPFSYSPEHYRQWLNLFGRSKNHRKLCRITISNISHTTDNLNQTRDLQQFLEACKTFVSK